MYTQYLNAEFHPAAKPLDAIPAPPIPLVRQTTIPARVSESESVASSSNGTGAAAAAIGQYGIVSMGTAAERHTNRLKDSGHRVHERLAEFPFWEEYDELMKSDIADQKNIGGPYGGAITAGKFLAKFTNYPYYHLDIAGPAFIAGKDAYRTKGATGVGVRLLFDFFSNLYK